MFAQQFAQFSFPRNPSPIHQSLMMRNGVYPISSHSDQTHTESPQPKLEAIRHTVLPFNRLRAFEKVQDQYQELGVYFSQAIAIHPSNPAFQTDRTEPVIMPIQQQADLTIQLSAPWQTIALKIMSTCGLTLTTYDSSRSVLQSMPVLCNRPLYDLTDLETPLPERWVQFSAADVLYLTLQSSTPFVLTHFQGTLRSSASNKNV